MTLDRNQSEWEDLAELDPFWAILTGPERKFGRGDVEAFFASGREEVAALMARCTGLGYPARRDAALDFGCGVGRVTQALAEQFGEVWGVDIAEGMLTRARELNAGVSDCRFVQNTDPHLGRFEDNAFDLVYSNIVLQHIPVRRTILAYIREFIRIVRPGGLVVFQLPAYIPWRGRVQMARRLYHLLRRLGVGKRYLYERRGYLPLGIAFVPERTVRMTLDAVGGHVLDACEDRWAGPGIRSLTYWVTKDAGDTSREDGA